MDYKQKYEEALENFRKIKEANKDNKELIDFIESKYPELKESDDEKIRKTIFKALSKKDARDVLLANRIQVSDALAWLEKQGEKTVISHKFNIGDWIVSKCGGIYQIKEVMRGSYSLLCANNVEKIVSITQVDNTSRLLCISDIKKLEKQGEPQVRTGSDWVKTIDDACEHRYAEEYAHGEYCHQQSFRWGFQEGANWFEKQSEQKPTDKIEPKFKVGDWVVTKDGKVNQVKTVSDDYDAYTLDDDTYFNGSWKDNYHLWTIKDAKDGDILVENNKAILLFKQIGSNKCNDAVYCYAIVETNINNRLSILEMYEHWGYASENQLKPATKEQRDLLFQKIKEAGYEWNAEKKELKKIEQKSIWSEEDEKMLNGIIDAASHHCYLNITDVEWLKSIKERMKGE